MVRPGYKQTEVGMIPEDWASELLDAHSKRGSGHTPSKKYPEYYKGSIVWISLADSADLDRGEIENSFITISEKGIQNSSAVLHPKGTVLLSRDAGVGKSAVAGCALCVSQHFMTWACNEWSLHNWFLYHYLQHKKSEFERIAIGSTIKTIGLPFFKSYRVPLPSYPEQRAIAGALSDVDGLIQSLEKLIAKKRAIKTGTMQQLLTGKQRLPGFSGEWETKRLGDLAEVRDGTHQTPKYVESGVPFYSVEHVTSGDFNNTKFISEAEHRFLTRSFKMEKGDILMTRIGSIGDCKLIDWDVDASFYVSLALLKIKKGHSSSFICHYSKSAAFQKEADLHSLQSAIPKKINLGPISNIKVELPPLEEQQAIAEVLSDMDAEIQALETKLAKTKAIKQGMMSELLTGKTRLVAHSNG